MVNKKIYLNSSNIDRDDSKTVVSSLNTGWVATFGDYIFKVEEKLKKITNSRYVCLLNSGTSALHLALKYFNFKEYSEVIVPSLTFISPINSVLYCNLKPVFIDVDKNHHLDSNKLLYFLKYNTFKKGNKTYNKKTKKQIVAIIVVHMWGNIGDIIKIKKICKNYNIELIEDAAEALGSFIKTRNKLNHAGTFAKIGCLSFNGNKIVTGGNGGAIITNDKKIYEKVYHLATQAKSDNISFKHDAIGFNYKMSNLNASLLFSQLNKLNFFLKQKKKIHEYYLKKLKYSKIFTILPSSKNNKSNHWLNLIKINVHKTNPQLLHIYLKKFNIETRRVWYPNDKHPMFKKFQNVETHNSKKIYDKFLCIPSGTNLKKKSIDKITNLLNNYEKNLYSKFK